MKKLKDISTLSHLVAWNNSIDPKSDQLQELELSLGTQFNHELESFVKSNPMHPVSIFNADEVAVPSSIKDEYNKKAQELNNKYMDMRSTKSEPDDEYFKLFDDMVSITKEYMSAAGYSHPMQLTDSRVGDPSSIVDLVEKLGDVSSDFIKDKPKNNTEELKEYSVDDIHNLFTPFDNIGYRISDKNGSFMTPIDETTTKIHINEKNDTFDMMSSATHELGHSRYQTDVLNKNTEVGKIGGMVSLSLHESSSIFHEITLSGIDGNVSSGYHNIKRLGADKVHYILHILIRMKIEEQLFSGEIVAKDIPGVWNNLIFKYTGLTPKNDWDGFLQDVHWNSGAFGYFHSYAVGFFNAITMYRNIKTDIVDGVTNQILLDLLIEEIERFYGNYNEYSFGIMNDMYDNLDEAIERYREFVFTKFTYSEE